MMKQAESTLHRQKNPISATHRLPMRHGTQRKQSKQIKQVQKESKQQGLTLLELMIAMTLFIIVTGFAIPAFSSAIVSSQLTSNTNALVGLIHQARAHGAYHANVLLCAKDHACQQFPSSTDQLILIEDKNRNQRFDANETILTQLSLPKGMTIQWRSFRRKPWLAINRLGVAYFQNGHFLLCYKGMARKVVLNYQAKTRIEREVIDTSRCP